MNTRSRLWCLTVNNYDESDLDQILDYMKGVEYGIVGREVGEECHTPHLQIYFRLKNAVTFSSLKKKFKKAHIEAAKANDFVNREYCIKGDNYTEFGKMSEQGKRTDLDEIKEVLKDTGKMRDVVLVAKSYQAVKMAEQYLKYHEQKRNWKPIVKWYWGATGCGKTHNAVKELGDDYYTCNETSRWWDGYDGHENVLIDDMRKNFTTFNNLLRILDRYAYALETKGGMRQLLAKKIIITSCYNPNDLFETREDIQQLIRRIDEIKEFNTPYIPCEDEVRNPEPPEGKKMRKKKKLILVE